MYASTTEGTCPQVNISYVKRRLFQVVMVITIASIMIFDHNDYHIGMKFDIAINIWTQELSANIVPIQDFTYMVCIYLVCVVESCLFHCHFGKYL